ncbi:DUF4386 domain-containing protein [Streptomyces sp. NPDC051561]|uniref:DUF4386 domain-containing protein n=1 Tax=Streptomyces sp. NPDC051561 TaxID=3365658 RepID=UPI0037AAD534
MSTTTAHHPPDTSGSNSRARSGGSALLPPVLAFAALTIAYVVLNSSTPQPTATGAEVLTYTGANGTKVKVGALLLLASAIPLAVLTPALHRRLRDLGGSAQGAALALVGGVLGTVALALSALFAWTGGRLPADAEPALARAVADLSFLTGGVTYAVAFALLVGAVALSGPLPGPLAAVGLVIAAAGMLGTLSLVADVFGYALPVVRFGGLIWLVWVAAVLSRKR